MIPLKPSLFIQPQAAPSSCVQAARLERRPTLSSSQHTSSFRSLLLGMQIYSPSVKVVELPGLGTSQPHPVFCSEDHIRGEITLDPSCSQDGRLTISLEGAFEYFSVQDNPDDEYSRDPAVRNRRHVFLTSSTSIPISSVPDPRPPIREALSVRKRPSTSSLKTPASRSCAFSFEPPRGSRPGGELPPTFSSKTPPGALPRQSRTEELEVAYRITAVWEASDGFQPKAILDAPVLFQPDTDFQSFDGFAMEPEYWLEMPLISERPIPFKCAVTLSRLQISRCCSIPYFVVFATNTRSPRLVKEIAADATIVVSLIRKITITTQRPPQLPILPDTPPASDESDSQTSLFAPHSLLKRSVKTLTRSHPHTKSSSANKPLPRLPQEAFSVSRTLETQLFVGFPKRPRVNDGSQGVPDGLCKGKVQLSKDMLPSVDWPGMTVQYHLDVSVLVGQDDVRASVPIWVY